MTVAFTAVILPLGRISDLRVAAVVSLLGSPALGLQHAVGICGRKPHLAQSVPADQVIRVRSGPPMLLLPSEAVPEAGIGHEAENSVTDWPLLFATQTWVPSEVMPSGLSNP